jgi:hypothetical protein
MNNLNTYVRQLGQSSSMARLESDETDQALRGKMQAVRIDRADWYYKIYNEQGVFVSSTSISKGSKETLRDQRVRDMAHQLGLSTSQQFVNLVRCILSREEALRIIQINRPPGTPRDRNR